MVTIAAARGTRVAPPDSLRGDRANASEPGTDGVRGRSPRATMMRRGRQAADDGSFARSVGVHTARGALLIGVAVVLGLVLLQHVDSNRTAGDNVQAITPTTVVRTTIPPITTTTRAPRDVKVMVANGTPTNGVAATAQRPIAQAGYNVLAPVDGTAAAKAARRNSTVYYAAGYDGEARKIADLLQLSPPAPIAPMPTVLPVSDLKGSNILVLVGPDYAAKHGGPSTSGPTTSTTRRL